jgi:hypothetical protein
MLSKTAARSHGYFPPKLAVRSWRAVGFSIPGKLLIWVPR